MIDCILRLIMLPPGILFAFSTAQNVALVSFSEVNFSALDGDLGHRHQFLIQSCSRTFAEAFLAEVCAV